MRYNMYGPSIQNNELNGFDKETMEILLDYIAYLSINKQKFTKEYIDRYLTEVFSFILYLNERNYYFHKDIIENMKILLKDVEIFYNENFNSSLIIYNIHELTYGINYDWGLFDAKDNMVKEQFQSIDISKIILPKREYNTDKYFLICPYIAKVTIIHSLFYYLHKNMDETELYVFYSLIKKDLTFLSDFKSLLNLKKKTLFLEDIRKEFEDKFNKDIDTIDFNLSENYFYLILGEYIHMYKFQVLGGLLTPMIQY